MRWCGAWHALAAQHGWAWLEGSRLQSKGEGFGRGKAEPETGLVRDLQALSDPGGYLDVGFADLLTWPALNRLLDTHRLEPPRLRLALGGDTVPVSEYCRRMTYRRMPPREAPQPHLVGEQLRNGATLVLDAVEEMHPPIGAMVSTLERHLRTGVQVNAYASWTAKEGFGVHWDDHDVIVLQVSGAKRWRVYGPTRPAPLYRDVEFDDTPPEHPIDEFTLQTGDALHVPRGWWHAAAASTGQPSLHLTCGLTTHTSVDLLSWLVDELRAEPTVRADLPRTNDENSQSAWRREITKLLTERLADPSVIGAYLAARDVAHGGRGGHMTALLGLGTYRCRDVADAARTAIAAGITMIDTAPVYARGNAHARLAGLLPDHPSVRVSTKVGHMTLRQAEVAQRAGVITPDEAARCHSIAPAYLERRITTNIAELGRRPRDLLYLHNPEHDAHGDRARLLKQITQAFSVCERAAHQGRIRGYGVAT